MSDILHSNILDVGSRFIVVGGGARKKLSIGTMGVIHYLEGVDAESSNIVYACVSILRYGKNGKARLKTETILLPAFYINDPDFTEDFTKVIPKPELSQYVYLRTLPEPSITVYKMSNLDYLIWAIPKAAHLYKLSKCTKLQGVWPQNQSDIMNTTLNASISWQQDSPYTYAICCYLDTRVEFIERMRAIEAILLPCAMLYKTTVTATKIQAAQQLWKHYQTTTVEEVRIPLHKVLKSLEKEHEKLTRIKNERGASCLN